jgi:hypothetical protein
VPSSDTGSRVDAPSVFYHLTLNTGHVALQARSGVADRAIDSLLPVIERKRAPVPGLKGWVLDFWFPLTRRRERRRPGAAFFQIALRPNRSVMNAAVKAMACWDESMTQDSWDLARERYLGTKEAFLILGTWRESRGDRRSPLG